MTDNYLSLLPELFIDERGPYFIHDGIEIRNPAQSENGMEYGRAVLNRYGFDTVGTGGGCTAWVMVFRHAGREVYLMVTDASGCYSSIEPGDTIIVGVRDRETGDVLWEDYVQPINHEPEED